VEDSGSPDGADHQGGNDNDRQRDDLENFHSPSMD
jgi:hypothetical protein